MIITIDGPAASGKSTVARLVAQKLGYFYLSSGLLYRALAYILRTEYNYTDSMLKEPSRSDVLAVIAEMTYQEHENGSATIFFRDRPLIKQINNPQVARDASIIGLHPFVRALLRTKQRELVEGHSAVVEGRDMGTGIFPQADYKFFLQADLKVRGERLQVEQRSLGRSMTLDEACAALYERDERDIHRGHGALKKAPDALVIDTSSLSIEQVVKLLLEYIQR